MKERVRQEAKKPARSTGARKEMDRSSKQWRNNGETIATFNGPKSPCPEDTYRKMEGESARRDGIWRYAVDATSVG